MASTEEDHEVWLKAVEKQLMLNDVGNVGWKAIDHMWSYFYHLRNQTFTSWWPRNASASQEFLNVDSVTWPLLLPSPEETCEASDASGMPRL